MSVSQRLFRLFMMKNIRILADSNNTGEMEIFTVAKKKKHEV